VAGRVVGDGNAGTLPNPVAARDYRERHRRRRRARLLDLGAVAGRVVREHTVGRCRGLTGEAAQGIVAEGSALLRPQRARDGGEVVRRVVAEGLALFSRRGDAAQAPGPVEAARLIDPVAVGQSLQGTEGRVVEAGGKRGRYVRALRARLAFHLRHSHGSNTNH